MVETLNEEREERGREKREKRREKREDSRREREKREERREKREERRERKRVSLNDIGWCAVRLLPTIEQSKGPRQCVRPTLYDNFGNNNTRRTNGVGKLIFYFFFSRGEKNCVGEEK